jgi:hypothetical protein
LDTTVGCSWSDVDRSRSFVRMSFVRYTRSFLLFHPEESVCLPVFDVIESSQNQPTSPRTMDGRSLVNDQPIV